MTAARLGSATGTAPPRSTPVVLVHGYAGHRAPWLPLARRLTRAGFVNLHAMTYNAFTTPLPAIAGALVRTCERVLERAGSDRVHLLGHSLGGLVIRYALQHGKLADQVGTAVTVAAPLGAGVGVSAKASQDRIAAAVRAVLDQPRYAAAARGFAQVLATEARTRPSAADRAERLLAGVSAP